MNRLDAMTGLINYRLSKTVRNPPVRAMVRGVPIYIGVDQEGATGVADSGFLSNVPDAIRQTGADVETLRNEVFTAANFGGVQNKEASDFYVNVIVPFLKDWNDFAYSHTHGWDKFADNWIILGGLASWNSINQYRRRLVEIRKAAEKFIEFKSPSPLGPSENLIQQAANQAKLATEALWKVLKWVIIFVTGAVSILAVIYIGGAM